MSLFSKIGSALSSAWKSVRGVVAPVVGGAIGGPVGAAVGTAIGGGALTKGAPAVVSSGALVPVGARGTLSTLPGAGTIAAGLGGIAAGALGSKAIGTLMSDGTVRKRRRRSRGISATELKNHARVERFLDKSFKCKRGGTRGTYVRKRSSR